jgi:Transglutaminase-like enzymes, putative cysteine proteases
MLSYNEYLHPESDEIKCFIEALRLEGLNLSDAVRALFRWFDENISYSRLNAPYDPLQRSDLDVLKMKSGTCGDYTNLLVSVLSRLGYQTKYAFVSVDCYGNPQDHICAAVLNAERWLLIDATLPYRKWHGFDCPHAEYELLSIDDAKNKLKQEEQYWSNKAIAWKKPYLAGLLYAPWIHEEIVLRTDHSLETIFFLLIIDSAHKYHIDAYYCVYSETHASCMMLCRENKDETSFCFSDHRTNDMWDEKQWGEAYPKECIPECYNSGRLSSMRDITDEIFPLIRKAASP